MGNSSDNITRRRHRAVIMARLRTWYSAQLDECSGDAEVMLQRIEQMELPTAAEELQYSFPLTHFRSGRA